MTSNVADFLLKGDLLSQWQLLGADQSLLPPQLQDIVRRLPPWIVEDIARNNLTFGVAAVQGSPARLQEASPPSRVGFGWVHLPDHVDLSSATALPLPAACHSMRYVALVSARPVPTGVQALSTLGTNHKLIVEQRIGRASDGGADGTVLIYRSFGGAALADTPDDLALQVERLTQELDAERRYSADVRMHLEEIVQSSSWKRTAPLRRLIMKARGQTYTERPLPVRPSLPVYHSAPSVQPALVEPAVAQPPAQDRPLIVIVLDTFDIGGLEKVVLDLSMRLVARGTNLKILVVRTGGATAQATRKVGIEVIEFGGDLAAMEAAIVALKPAVAISKHSYACHDVFVRCGTRIIEVLHNIYHWQRNNQQIDDVRKLAWRIAAVSRAVEQYAVDHLHVAPARITVITNGIEDTGLVRPSVDELRRARRASPVTTFVIMSHIWANKCHLALLSAFEDVYRKYPQARLKCSGAVGHADVAEALHRRIDAAGLRDVVDVSNAADRNAVSAVYSAAHVFVLPSIVEGFSIATLEGAYFGLPMILSDTGGARDLLIDAAHGRPSSGLIIDGPVKVGDVTPEEVDRVGRLDRPDHVARLAAAMIDMIENRDAWIDRGLEGVDRVKLFHIDNTVDQYMSLIDKALEHRAVELQAAAV